MAPITAQFRIRIDLTLLVNKRQDSSKTDLILTQPYHDEKAISSPPPLPHLALVDLDKIPLENRLAWVTAISDHFLGATKQDRNLCVRDIDLILKGDGSIENLVVEPSIEKDGLGGYPARYQIPKAILDRIDSTEEKIKRTELFALGCILYQLISGKGIFPDLSYSERDEEEIERRYVEGPFPDDVWSSDKAVRILACWCPEFARELLDSRGNGKISIPFALPLLPLPPLFSLRDRIFRCFSVPSTAYF
jgi:hypothetical protein